MSIDPPRLVLDTLKREAFGGLYVDLVPSPPPETYYYMDEGVVVEVDQTPVRAGQVVAYAPVGSNFSAVLYVSVEIDGVLQWKPKL